MNNITPLSTADRVRQSLARRRWIERCFHFAGFSAVALATLFILLLFSIIIKNAIPGLLRTEVLLDIKLQIHSISGKESENINYHQLLKDSLFNLFPELTSRKEKKQLQRLISQGAPYQIRAKVQEMIATRTQTDDILRLWLPAASVADIYYKRVAKKSADTLPAFGKISAEQAHLLTKLKEMERLRITFNHSFFTNGDSRSPELAGIRGALMGSLYTLLITLLLSFPIGVASACYLEEFAPRNRWTDWIEISINNLAAVPSIVFGLLGLAIFINFFGLPRSLPLVGGLVLSLMTLPTIIITSRAAIKSVSPSIRAAALGIGASPMQTLFHHVLPLALPGILTGTIIGMAQALGESAPLLMIGMVAFLVDIPGGPMDPATVLPVQIFLWADSPERGFVEKTSAAILVLIGFLVAMNMLAVIIRNRFQRKC